MYHLNCLTAFHRKYDAASKRDSAEEGEHWSTWLESVALAELFDYIELSLKQNPQIVMPLSELQTLYTNRIRELGQPEVYVHSTRLKEKIAASFPQLTLSQTGRNFFFSKNAIELSAADEDFDSEARILMKAAKIVRKHLFDSTSSLDGKQESSVPHSLLTLVYMLLQGSNFLSADNGVSQAVLTIAQLTTLFVGSPLTL